ncbi:hypothetical protein F8M41_023579 [Gigaspora margarita]|uniref:Uncharacterized protein n=1 Tax=Gigaspora margarita TaxID=4874 RepID=A0A8H4B0S2_GIGMA|nr:hypothetical protein F8M41_023579 [Gigaspora margarita]
MLDISELTEQTEQQDSNKHAQLALIAFEFSQYANTWEATNLLPNRHRKLRTQRELLDSDAGSLNNIQVVFSSWTLKNKNYFEMQNKTDYEELLGDNIDTVTNGTEDYL